MFEAQFITHPGGMLRPANQADADRIQRIGTGKLVSAKLVQPRNARFHRKYFALLGLAYEYWTPPEVSHNGLPAAKNEERFREEIQIAAGHYEIVVSIKGEARAISKSISFANMDDLEFAELYKSVFNVCWRLVLSKVNGMTESKVEQVVNELLRFD